MNSNVLNNAVTRLNNEYKSLTDASSRLAYLIDQVNTSNSMSSSIAQDVVNIVGKSSEGINNFIRDLMTWLLGHLTW